MPAPLTQRLWGSEEDDSRPASVHWREGGAPLTPPSFHGLSPTSWTLAAHGAPGDDSLGGARLDGGAGSSGAQHASSGGTQLLKTAMQAGGNLDGAGGGSAGPVRTDDLSGNGESFVFGARGVGPGVGIQQRESLDGSAASGGGGGFDGGCGVRDGFFLDDSEVGLAFGESLSPGILDVGRCGSELGVRREQVLRHFRQESQLQLQQLQQHRPLPLVGTGGVVNRTSPPFPPVLEPGSGAGEGFRGEAVSWSHPGHPPHTATFPLASDARMDSATEGGAYSEHLFDSFAYDLYQGQLDLRY